MIARLTGLLVEELDGSLLVDVGGVGYEVTAPLGTRGRVRLDAEGRGTLLVHTHVREDVLQLFGFATEADRAAFRVLIGVASVGPRTAVSILSALPAPELARAIARKELTTLTSIPGVGKKTAERLLLELKDKLPEGPLGPGVLARAREPASPTGGGPAAKGDLLFGALTKMGYKAGEAERAVAALGSRVDEAELPALLREALALLAK
ncbi:MAG TPA: Holliday junction branch migration protein RuvA [Polyangiaceae bacterium]|nr:Holliday junction branch migration protein RuvA [Polyangiaceae bacterium]